MSNDTDWRHEYPWGRQSPEARLAQLSEKRAKVERQRRMFQARFEEKMIELDRRVEAIDGEIVVAERCKQDRLRRQIKAVAHRLFDRGIDVLGRLKTEEPSQELLAELSEIEESGDRKADGEKSANGAKAGGVPNAGPTGLDDGLLGDDLVTVDDITENQP